MSAGRNRWIAAWAFAALMAIPCGEAVAASVTVPAGSPIPGVSTPALTTPDIPVTAACAVEPAPTGGSGDRRTRGPGTAVVRSGATGRIRPPGTHSGGAGCSDLRQRPRVRCKRKTEACRWVAVSRNSAGPARSRLAFRRSEALGVWAIQTRPAGHDRRLAHLLLASDFPGGTSTAAMSWAVPLLAIMLPIGLCGLLQPGRRREVDG